MSKKSVLGMGLAGLLGSTKIPASMQSFASQVSGSIAEIEITKIYANASQPRKDFAIESLNDLAASLKEHGLLQPIIVTKSGEKYKIVSGERRYRASIIAGFKTIKCIVQDYNEKQIAAIALIENIQRENLSMIEEANAYLALQSDFAMTQDEIAKSVGKSRSHIANMLRIANIDEDVKVAMVDNNISYSHAKIVAGKKDAKKLVRKIVKDKLTVRQLESLIYSGEMSHELAEDKLKNACANANIGLKLLKTKATKTEIAILYSGDDDIKKIFDVIKKIS